MFESLTAKLQRSFRNLMGQGKLTEANTQEMWKEVREALIDADVAYEVIEDFLHQIKTAVLGMEVSQHLSPGQELIKIINAELIKLLGENPAELNFRTEPPVIVLMAGLQGSGKTTSAAKLAKWLIDRQAKSVLVASTDIYRPAAITQLELLATEVGASFFPSLATQDPVNIAQDAVMAARKQHIDVVIIDTAGRLHIDDQMMAEIKNIHHAIKPTEVLFVVDGMTGQDAAKTAKVFNDTLPLTGVIVTKLDGDTRGGAILSVRAITGGKPIKFIGMGEKVEALEPFYPERMASRILGMGDILSLVEELERKVDKQEADAMAKKMAQGTFDLADFRTQLIQMKSMGGVAGLMDKLPGMGAIPQQVKDKANDGAMDQMVAIIGSMTPKERKRPLLIENSGSRKRRIAKGAGVDIQAVNRVLKQFNQMQKMMEKMRRSGGIAKMMQGLQAQMGKKGGVPGGFPFG